MGNPFTPDPTTPAGHGKYVERAQMLGEAGRRGQIQEDPEEFRSLLDGEVKPEEEIPDPLRREDLEALENAAAPASAGATSSLTLDADESEARREKSGREETEKRLGSWRGPSVFGGLPAAASLGLVTSVQVHHGERSRGGTRASQRVEIRPSEARVDPEMIQALLEAGLRRPITGLEDPRLATAPPHLAAEEGWSTSPTGKGLAIHWETANRSAGQRMEWSEGALLLETTAGSRVQTLERQGAQVFVRHATRDVPPRFPV